MNWSKAPLIALTLHNGEKMRKTAFKQSSSHRFEVIAASAVPDVGLVATMTSLPSGAWKLPLEARQPGQTSGTI